MSEHPKQVNLRREFMDRNLADGLYIVTEDTEVLELAREPYLLNPDEAQQARAFLAKHKEGVIASAYETSCTLLLSKRPDKYTGPQLGSGFNYGSTNLVGDLPARHSLLILAEND